MVILNITDYINKNILLIGNKPIEQLTENQINYINSFDIIVRCNGLNNLEQTGGRIDWWWLNIWNWDAIKSNLGDKDYDKYELIMMDKQTKNFITEQSLLTNLPKIKNINNICYTNQDSFSLYNQKDLWKINYKDNVPTTDVICLSYLLNKFQLSNIHLMCLDIDNREELFKTHKNWSKTWHKNVGGLERDYINKYISNNKLTFIDIEQIK
jgi:hypothetical protein